MMGSDGLGFPTTKAVFGEADMAAVTVGAPGHTAVGVSETFYGVDAAVWVWED